MTTPLETEIKLAASPAMLASLRDHPLLRGDEEPASEVSTYFDTADGKIQKRRGALRVRAARGEHEQTLKLPAADGSIVRRGEWNAAITTGHPVVSRFSLQPRRMLGGLVGKEALVPVAVTRIERSRRKLHYRGSLIEAAFDAGTVEAGSQSEPICELELELLHGDPCDLFELALELPLGAELTWAVRSKAERGYALAFDRRASVAYGRDVTYGPGADVAEGFRAIGWACLDHLLANYPLVIASGDPEAVHQCRVAIRRLRAAFSVFGGTVEDAVADELRAEFKAVASGLGPARDLHVLHKRVARHATAAEAADLLAHLAARRDAATRAAADMLAGEPFQRLLFQFARWLECGEWLGKKKLTGADRPLQQFAADVLVERRRKLLRRARKLADLNDAARHRVRIQGKKLRYASAFFASLWPESKGSKPRVKFVKALSSLQECLGQLNDIAVGSTDQTALFTELDPITAARLETDLQAVFADNGRSRRKLVKSAERAVERLADTPLWWREA